jgi:hypothetical protein
MYNWSYKQPVPHIEPEPSPRKDRAFRPLLLLAVILGVTAVLALISFVLQVYYLGIG